VEEAGEILESHIMTALSEGIEQIILIGDHQYEHHHFIMRFHSYTDHANRQLRPKVNNYDLTVEKGDGFDLNRSLFERLVLKGYPHTRLKAQHRMRPEISALIRHLTYPDLIDAPKTKNRENVRGLSNNLILINHEQPETEVTAEERRDMSAKSSKQNQYVWDQGYQGGPTDLVALQVRSPDGLKDCSISRPAGVRH